MPALSSSCAAALSSTPVIRKANAARVIGRLTRTRRGSRASSRIGTPCAAQSREPRRRTSAHSPASSADPRGLPVRDRRRCAVLRLGVDAQRHLVAEVHQRGRAAQVERQRSGRTCAPGRTGTSAAQRRRARPARRASEVVRRARRAEGVEARRSADLDRDQRCDERDARRCPSDPPRGASPRANARQRDEAAGDATIASAADDPEAGSASRLRRAAASAPTKRREQRPVDERAAQHAPARRRAASGSVEPREPARIGCGQRRQATSSASAGNIGRMYDGSLEPEALKKTKTNADQASAKRCQEKPLPAAGPGRGQPAQRRPAKTSSQGSRPAARSRAGSTTRRRCAGARW